MLHAKYMTTSGILSTEPFWYYGCILIREDKTKASTVQAFVGSNAMGVPIWKYTLGESDARSVRLLRSKGDETLIEGGVYVTLTPDTTFIAYYRQLGG